MAKTGLKNKLYIKQIVKKEIGFPPLLLKTKMATKYGMLLMGLRFGIDQVKMESIGVKKMKLKWLMQTLII
jgi:hypothetical protein